MFKVILPALQTTKQKCFGSGFWEHIFSYLLLSLHFVLFWWTALFTAVMHKAAKNLGLTQNTNICSTNAVTQDHTPRAVVWMWEHISLQFLAQTECLMFEDLKDLS